MTTEVVDMITVVIDGFEVTVPKGTLVIRAAEQLGIQIPRFCDHPLLEPVGACRQCLVDIEINGRAFPKPQASCTIPVEPGMIVKTQLTSTVAEKAQRGVMELLLVNHPLDCPVCDKGGECPLQNQAMSTGEGSSRFEGVKRVFEKPINISSQVLLDRERCVLCARCTRFSEQIASDPFITLNERGALQQVGIYENKPFESYFSGNTVQICPVGALTGAAYRFRARPFDLVSTPSACEHCASGCDMRTDVRRGKTLRRLAGDDASVNEEWNCDKGRWAFKYVTAVNRLKVPQIRNAEGVLEEEAALSNRAWLMKIKKNRPFFTWKVAATLDGKVAATDGTSKWISNTTSRADVQKLRRQSDAILVGTNTVIADNPHLIPRGDFAGYTQNPIRIICGEQELPSDSLVFDDAARTEIVKSKNLDLLVEKLNELGVNQVLVEAGPTLASAMLDHCLMDELVIYQAPSLLGSGESFFKFGQESTIENQLRMDHISTQVLDGDVKSIYRIRNGE